MKTNHSKLLMSVAAIALLGASALSTSSCKTDQGHGYRGHEDSQTAVKPAYQRALERTRR